MQTEEPSQVPDYRAGVTSPRKKRAARKNGKLGGRPRNSGGPTELAEKLGVSRQRAAKILADIQAGKKKLKMRLNPKARKGRRLTYVIETLKGEK